MANELDELNGTVNASGNDVNVIQKQIPVKVGGGSIFFEVILWILCIIPGLVFLLMKISARNYLRQLQQKLQHNASQIDNFLEQRVQILQNAAALVSKSVELDKDVMKSVAALRSGINPSASGDQQRVEYAAQVDNAATSLFGSIKVQMEKYPDLQSHNAIRQAMQDNSYLQREITAAREIYNDTVLQWNTEIFRWPTKQIVAARAGYTTRIPFSVSAEVKAQARSVFFN
ncbi:LemA family protein [Mycoplasmopsis felifaucium]|uniref:LemA family protein n=1 Tax=Mycoplasmopsis felifaucium TaxID=35768 RepID=UPI000489737F|nr:LemA family protein [Mycoplasmopsis felifaucium]